MIQLTEAYLTSEAEEKAKLFLFKEIDKNQIRKFYDDFKVLELKINDKIKDKAKENRDLDEEFKKEILPLVKFVKSKIAYSAGRKSNNKKSNNNLVPKEFKEYMDNQINKIETIQDFRNFMLHYQAILAYYTYHKEFGKDEPQSMQNKKNR